LCIFAVEAATRIRTFGTKLMALAVVLETVAFSAVAAFACSTIENFIDGARWLEGKRIPPLDVSNVFFADCAVRVVLAADAVARWAANFPTTQAFTVEFETLAVPAVAHNRCSLLSLGL
jgi:hypothetical protein